MAWSFPDSFWEGWWDQEHRDYLLWLFGSFQVWLPSHLGAIPSVETGVLSSRGRKTPLITLQSLGWCRSLQNFVEQRIDDLGRATIPCWTHDLVQRRVPMKQRAPPKERNTSAVKRLSQCQVPTKSYPWSSPQCFLESLKPCRKLIVHTDLVRPEPYLLPEY